MLYSVHTENGGNMKHLFLSLAVILAACTVSAPEFENEREIYTGAENKKCLDFNTIKVSQTLTDGYAAVANVCDDDDDTSCNGMAVLVHKYRDALLWDDKVIKIPDDRCFVIINTQVYETEYKTRKTAPVLGVGYKHAAETADEYKMRFDEYINRTNERCINTLLAKNSKNTRVDVEKICLCTMDGVRRADYREREKLMFDARGDYNFDFLIEQEFNKQLQMCKKEFIGKNHKNINRSNGGAKRRSNKK